MALVIAVAVAIVVVGAPPLFVAWIAPEEVATEAPLRCRFRRAQLWLYLFYRTDTAAVSFVGIVGRRRTRGRRLFGLGYSAGPYCEIFGVCAAERGAGFWHCGPDLFAAQVVAEIDRGWAPH